jgi:hypothetical protein
MIKNFRIEVEKEDKQESMDIALDLARHNITFARLHGQFGSFECTDEVTARSDNGYTTRMKFIYAGGTDGNVAS